MKIINYPHPALRHKSKPIRRVDAELKKIVAEMFELMYEAEGIGLAANQIALPVRLFVVNMADTDEGEEMVFINPEISHPKGSSDFQEGCLSLPEVGANVRRPESVVIDAYNLKGEQIQGRIDGMLARVVQHETDHLDGVLFTDRLSDAEADKVRAQLEEFEVEYRSLLESGRSPTDEEVARQLAEWETKYC